MYIVYGGSFNPPTKAHLNIVYRLLELYPNSKVIVLPVGNSYNKPYLASFNDRFNMLKLMFNNANVIISRIEEKKQFDGTITSLDELSKKYNNIHLVIGSDHLVTLKNWIRYEELLEKYPLIIMNRNNTNIDEIMARYKGLDVKYDKIMFDHPASSTKVRNDFNNHKHWLEDNVYNYIVNNNLYGVNNNV